jgi:hypothetical protein
MADGVGLEDRLRGFCRCEWFPTLVIGSQRLFRAIFPLLLNRQIPLDFSGKASIAGRAW